MPDPDVQRLAQMLMGMTRPPRGYDATTAPAPLQGVYQGLAPSPDVEYGSILPIARNRVGSADWVTQGDNTRLALPDTVRSGLFGIADLLAGVDTGQVTPRAAETLALGALGSGAAMAPRGALASGGSIKAYHGTRNKPEIMESGFRPSRDGGVYFTDAPLDALEFANMKYSAGTPKVMRAELDFANPLTINARGEVFDPSITEQAIAQARAGGHDAVVLRNIQNFEHGAPSTTYIALDDAAIRRRWGLGVPAPVATPDDQRAAMARALMAREY